MNAKAISTIGLVVLVGAVLLYPSVAPPKKVTVEHVGGGQCATADPDPVEVRTRHLDNFFKKQKVRWYAKDENKEKYTWTFEFKGGGANLLDGPYTIPSDKKKSKKTKNSAVPGDWSYRIIVADSSGNEICRSDPIIVIRR